MNTDRRSHTLVTGASSGIGQATALWLAAAGHHVYAGVRRPDDGVALQRDAAGEITPVMLDVTDADQISAALVTISEHVGDAGLTGLVNNAGIGVFGPLELVPLQAFRLQMEVNVTGQLAVTQAFLPLIRRAQGRIVFMGSVGDRVVVPFLGPLAGSKFALSAMAQALRQELAPWGVRVVLVEPASIASEAPAKFERDAKRLMEETTAAGRALYEQAFGHLVREFGVRSSAGSPPRVVAETVGRALAARRPRARYLTGKDARRLALMAALPATIGDSIRRRIFKLPTAGSAVVTSDQGGSGLRIP